MLTLAADLALLERTFGREGIQALEVDAAGPELSAIANDLLSVCSSGRWSVRIVTTQPLKSDPERSEEVFAIRSIDNEKHVERDATSNSGGEKVPIGEAISMALTVLACGRNAAQRPTLVRDESGAALDPENAKGYVAMLRRAAERVGADKVLLVSHDPSIWALADSRVRVGDGTIAVE
jgi:exonuclease SbcC